jgi:hypothetical protein
MPHYAIGFIPVLFFDKRTMGDNPLEISPIKTQIERFTVANHLNYINCIFAK